MSRQIRSVGARGEEAPLHRPGLRPRGRACVRGGRGGGPSGLHRGQDRRSAERPPDRCRLAAVVQAGQVSAVPATASQKRRLRPSVTAPSAVAARVPSKSALRAPGPRTRTGTHTHEFAHAHTQSLTHAHTALRTATGSSDTHSRPHRPPRTHRASHTHRPPHTPGPAHAQRLAHTRARAAAHRSPRTHTGPLTRTRALARTQPLCHTPTSHPNTAVARTRART